MPATSSAPASRPGSVRPDLDVERAVADILSPFVYIRMIRFEKVTDADRSAVCDELVGRFGSRRRRAPFARAPSDQPR